MITTNRSLVVWLNAGIALVTIVVAAAVYLYLLRPLESEAATNRSQAEELRQLVESAADVARENLELEAGVAKAEQASQTLLQRIPTSARESDFLAQICQLAERSDLDVVDYRPGAVHTLERHREMEVRLSTRGKYESLCTFLEQVDNLPRLCRLDHLEITAPPSGDILTTDMTFHIYFAPLQETRRENQGI